MADQAQTQQNLPPDNNNQDEEDDAIVADQAVGLAEIGISYLYKIAPALKQREEVESWVGEVEISKTHPFVRAIYIFLSHASNLFLWRLS